MAKVTYKFIEENKELFERRIIDSFIKDGHGDLHTKNIFISDEIYIYDCIEFNNRFRYGDYVADIAYLAMDLDLLGEKELSNEFIGLMLYFMEDEYGYQLVNFYKLYRALVKVKVNLFIGNREEATKYFYLAQSYAKLLSYNNKRLIFLITGLVSSGKSWIAKRLAINFNASLIRTDELRKELYGVIPSVNEGIYSTELISKIYLESLALAEDELNNNHNVVLDATFSKKEYRKIAIDLGKRTNARIFQASTSEVYGLIKERLLRRDKDASDANWQIYLYKKKYYEMPDEFEKIYKFHSGVDSYKHFLKHIENGIETKKM